MDADLRGFPLRVEVQAGGAAVTEILDRWRIDDEWWRKEISRMYFQVALATGAVLTIFQDLIQGGWFLQPVAKHLDQPEPVAVLAPKAKPRARQPRAAKQLRISAA